MFLVDVLFIKINFLNLNLNFFYIYNKEIIISIFFLTNKFLIYVTIL